MIPVNKFRVLLVASLAVSGCVVALFFLFRDNVPYVRLPPEDRPGEVVRTDGFYTPEARVRKMEGARRGPGSAEDVCDERLKDMTPEERMRHLLEKAAEKPMDLTPPPDRLFATASEQVLSWIFTTELGAVPPPLPRIPIRDEAHMAEILTAPNPIFDGDGEKAREAKLTVELAKKELLKHIGEGGTVHTFLEYYRGELMRAHNEWMECQKSVLKVLAEEPDIAADYIREVNERLSVKGIRPVNLPPQIKNELGIGE